MCTLPLFAFLRRMTEPTPFLPPFFPLPEISSFLGTSIAITLSGTQKVLLYISTCRRASSVIAKAKVEAWQTTLASLLPKSNPKFVYSLLRSVTGSSSSSSSSPNFPSCSSPRELASAFTNYPKSNFSVLQPKALSSRARGYLSELRRATCLEESHSFFCSPFSPAEYLAAAFNLSSSTATDTDKVAYPMLNYLPRSGIDFLLYIFNLSWTLHSFLSIWKISFIIHIHKIGKPLD